MTSHGTGLANWYQSNWWLRRFVGATTLNWSARFMGNASGGANNIRSFIWQMRNHIQLYSHLLITNAQWQSRHTAGGQHAIVCHSKMRYVRSGELWSAHQWLVNVHWHQTLTGSCIDQSTQITTQALHSNIGSISQGNLTHWWILRRIEPHHIIFLRGPAPHVPNHLASIEKASSKYGFMMRSGGLG